MNQKHALILAPGLTCDAAVWQAQVTGLSDIADIQIADTLSDDSITAMANRLLESAPDLFALAGFSMGGYVALEVMRIAPERITHLALLNTSAKAEAAGHDAVRKAAVQTAHARGFEKVLRGSLGLLLHKDAAPEIGDEVVSMALRVGLDTFEHQQIAIMGRPDAHPTLPSITVPTLILVGAEDLTTPPYYAEEMAATIPQSHLRILENCGHMSTMEQPDSVNQALREWLA